jgi:16S rRNA (guanine527-N7)-methyltransferase
MTGHERRALLLPYLAAMLRENEHVNLTAIRDPKAAEVLHVDDSLAIAGADLHPSDCLDLGSGNGFPGVALRVLFPDARVTLIERTRKKVLAIERALAGSGLEPVATLCMDAQQAPALEPGLRKRFDLVTARAVGKPREVARLARPFLAASGTLAMWLDTDTEAPAALEPRLRLLRVLAYELGAPAPRQRRIALYSAG